MEQVLERQDAAEIEIDQWEQAAPSLLLEMAQLDEEILEPRAELLELCDEQTLIERRPSPQYRKSGLQGFLFPGLNEAGQRRLEEVQKRRLVLEPHVRNLQRKRSEVFQLLEEGYRCVRRNRIIVAECRKKIEELSIRAERQRVVEEKKQRQRDRIAALREVAANAKAKGRKLAAAVRKTLEKQRDCPYCGESLGDAPHADHIYPMALGGRSASWNMVMVCADCNAKKAAMTLSEFIAAFQLDKQAIENRLRVLEKRL